MSEQAAPKNAVLGLGGVFLRANDPDAMTKWYLDTFKIEPSPEGNIVFQSGDADGPQARTVFAFFHRGDSYFDVKQPAMINLRVHNLDATLKELRSKKVRVVEEVADESYGRFGWCYDPEGNRIELWEPR